MDAEVKTEDDLLPPGAPVGTIATDLDQSTGLERLEILGKMEGVDVFDMKPLDSTRKGIVHPNITLPSPPLQRGSLLAPIAPTTISKGQLALTYATGTMKDPILVKSFGDEHYIGCTGVPADTHHQLWMVVSRERPIERCSECGNVIKMEYVGPTEDPHAHDHGDHGHGHESRIPHAPITPLALTPA